MTSKKLSIPFFIVLSVFLFNLPYLFVDCLWHDDGLLYYLATEGRNIHTVSAYGVQAKICILAPFLEWSYSHSMVYIGLPFTRGVFVSIMALASLLLYYLYRNTFGIDSKVAIMAAVIPNILPSLKGIPVGLNASYAMWALLPIIASLLLLTSSYKKQGFFAWLLFTIAFTMYAIGLNLAVSSNFLIPCVIFFFIFYLPEKKVRTIMYGVPFLLFGLWQAYKQYLYTHRTPTAIPLNVVIDRIQQFFAMSSFLPFNQSYSIYITFFLSVLGLAGLFFMSPTVYKQPSQLNYNKNYYRLLMVGWPLCWMIFNSFAYVALSPVFREYDYAYIFNFGTVLLQVAGIVLVINLLLEIINIKANTKSIMIYSLSFLFILFVGYQRVQYKSHPWGRKPSLERTSQIFRSALAEYDFPSNTQILVLGDNIDIFHSGVLKTCTGYIRYITGRKDICALIGPDSYPKDIFLPWKGFLYSMRGFDIDKPIAAFRLLETNFNRLNLLLQVKGSIGNKLPRLEWTLYDVGTTGLPLKIASGKEMELYEDYVMYHLPTKFRGTDIAFAPKGIPDDFVDNAVADSMARRKGLIDTAVKIGENLKLRNVLFLEKDNHFHFQLLVRVDSVPNKGFKLSYSVDGKTISVPLWEYVIAGDNILITTPPITQNMLSQGISLGFTNTGQWPPVPLMIQDRGGNIKQHLILQPNESSSASMMKAQATSHYHRKQLY